jgi:protein TonB
LKKSLIYSLILHVVVVLLALFLVQEKKGKEPPPFFARIITPDELQKEKALRPPKIPEAPKKEKTFRMPKLPKDMPSPKDLSAAPSGRSSEQKLPKGSSDTDSAATSTPPKDVTGKEGKGELPAPSGNRQGTSEKPAPKTFREKFFDKDVIGKLAQKGKEETKTDNGITFDTQEFKYYGYMQRLKEKIEGIWRYPSDAAEKGLFGDLYVKFTIKKNGKLVAVELVRTSGHKSLDDAAIKALKDAEPYWPLPDEWGKDGLTITGHFVYSLYGVYIR